MDRFRQLTVFVAVADAGAFNAAARRLNMSASAVTRLVNALEVRIGARLLTRTTRNVALTQAGERLLDDARRIMSELDDIEAQAAGAHQKLRGELRVSAPVLFGQRYIAPIVRDYLSAYPEVSVALELFDRVVHLLEEGVDVALRIGALPDSTLSAVRVGTVRHVTIASPEYLSASDRLAEPADLAGHRIVSPIHLHGSRKWQYHCEGKVIEVPIEPRLKINSVEGSIEAAVAGWGLTRALSYQVADALADGRLVEVLRDFEQREIPVQLVHHEGRQTTAKTRAFIDLARNCLRADARRLAAI